LQIARHGGDLIAPGRDWRSILSWTDHAAIPASLTNPGFFPCYEAPFELQANPRYLVIVLVNFSGGVRGLQHEARRLE
jgi:hypothetical protein